MRDDIVFVGADLNRMLALSIALQGKDYNVTVIHAIDEALAEAARCPGHPKAMLVAPVESANVADVRALLSGMPDTRVLFLTPDRPPGAALARIVRWYGAVIPSADDRDAVVTAALIATTTANSALVDAR